MKLLIAEDDVTTSRRISLACELMGWQVTCVADGYEAIQELEGCAVTQRYDAVLVDQYMPTLNGSQVIGWMRRQDTWQATPAVLMSAIAHPTQVAEALAYDRTAYAAKPVSTYCLRELLGTWVDELVYLSSAG